MDRREAIKKTSLLLGYSLSASAIAAALHACGPDGVAYDADTAWDPKFFTGDEAELVAELAETILPETDTPGAKSVGTHKFIDDALQNFHTPAEQYAFRNGLADVQARARAAHDRSFESCTPEERHALLIALERETRELRDAGEVHGTPFFVMLKQLTFLGYFSSETVGKDVLAYDPVPGEYSGCIPVTEDERLWSL